MPQVEAHTLLRIATAGLTAAAVGLATGRPNTVVSEEAAPVGQRHTDYFNPADHDFHVSQADGSPSGFNRPRRERSIRPCWICTWPPAGRPAGAASGKTGTVMDRWMQGRM